MKAIRRQGPSRVVEEVEGATLTWYNADRLVEPPGYVPPTEFAETSYDRQDYATQPAGLT